MQKFLVCVRDRETDKEIALGVLEERRRFERGDNIIGVLKLARKKFALTINNLPNMYVLKIF